MYMRCTVGAQQGCLRACVLARAVQTVEGEGQPAGGVEVGEGVLEAVHPSHATSDWVGGLMHIAAWSVTLACQREALRPVTLGWHCRCGCHSHRMHCTALRASDALVRTLMRLCTSANLGLALSFWTLVKMGLNFPLQLCVQVRGCAERPG